MQYTKETKLIDVKGVGEKTAALFSKKGIYTAEDLVRCYPRGYDYFDAPVSIEDARRTCTGQGESAAASVPANPQRPFALRLILLGNGSTGYGGGYRITNFRAGDETGQIRLTWFNMPYLARSLHAGETKVFRGYLKQYKNGSLQLEQPQIYSLAEYDSLQGTFQPKYPLTQGLKNAQFMRLVRKVLDQLKTEKDYLTEKEREDLGLPEAGEALKEIHFPHSRKLLLDARNRIVFDEFVAFLLAVRRQKAQGDKTGRIPDPMPMTDSSVVQGLIDKLPFKLTEGQQKAWADIREDLTGPYVMNRLLQGDVGSGKTILAILALLLCAENGRQGALMAPTEVLAQQHMDGVLKMTEQYGLPLRPVLLTGGMTAAAKKKAYAAIASGEKNVIIGTHALFQEKVVYRNLSLVITDEQHRFGVRQREALAAKGDDPGTAELPVHVLVMSATPIPRTLAIILYGDLQVSQLKGLPAERLPIKNLAAPASDRGKIYKFMMGQLRAGHQAYVICPAVEEGELEGIENVTDYAEKIRKALPEDIRIASLNGRMKPAEKSAVMADFAAHRTDILVSTTVIEVGINVPNATVMLVENAERFGLSQLHQLRGRVGRGADQSYCVFLYSEGIAEKPKRLQILEKTNDGFEIAEQDLKLRGPGDVFGTRQSGELGFELADIYEDAGILTKAAGYVDEKLHREPDFTFEGVKVFDARSI